MRCFTLACCLTILPAGCVTTTREYVIRPTGQETITLESAHDLPPVMGDFSYEQGVVRGHVGWTYDCRRAVVNKQIAEVYETRRPNKSAAVGSIVTGLILGVASSALISQAETFSDEQECSTDDDGRYTCSSPRERAYILGGSGMLTSMVAVGVGAATFGTKTTSSVVDSESSPPVVSRVVQEHARCGLRPIEGLGLSLLRAGQRVAFSSTNAEGDAAFAVPPNVTGGLMVVVDSVPMPITVIHQGDIVGSVQVEAVAPIAGSAP